MPDLMKLIEEAVMKHYAFPVLVKVSHSKDCFIDGEAILPGSLETTGELFKEIPVSPLWADSDGRGIYAPPAEGQIAIVSFIGGNKAFPFVSGIYAEDYTPVKGTDAKKLVILDGEGLKIEFDGKCQLKMSFDEKLLLTMNREGKAELKDDGNARFVIEKNKLEVGNGTATVKTLLEDILDLLSGFKTLGTGNMGAPVNSTPTPDVTAKAEVIKAKVGEVFGA